MAALIIAYLVFGAAWLVTCLAATAFGSWPGANVFERAWPYLNFGTPIVLILVGMVGVPVAVFLVRIGRASYRTAAVSLVGFLFALTTALWIFAAIGWADAYTAEAFLETVGLLAPFALPGGAAFSFGLVYALRRQQQRDTISAPSGGVSAKSIANA